MLVWTLSYRDFVGTICNCLLLNSFHVGVSEANIPVEPQSTSETLAFTRPSKSSRSQLRVLGQVTRRRSNMSSLTEAAALTLLANGAVV